MCLVIQQSKIRGERMGKKEVKNEGEKCTYRIGKFPGNRKNSE